MLRGLRVLGAHVTRVVRNAPSTRLHNCYYATLHERFASRTLSEMMDTHCVAGWMEPIPDPSCLPVDKAAEMWSSLPDSTVELALGATPVEVGQNWPELTEGAAWSSNKIDFDDYIHDAPRKLTDGWFLSDYDEFVVRL